MLPYMLCIVPVIPEKQAQIPSVCHVDGTARLQTVRKDLHPILHKLLEHVQEECGIHSSQHILQLERRQYGSLSCRCAFLVFYKVVWMLYIWKIYASHHRTIGRFMSDENPNHGKWQQFLLRLGILGELLGFIATSDRWWLLPLALLLNNWNGACSPASV